MKIIVPENVGGDLKVLPEGPCQAVVDRIIFGTSQTGNPKATVRWTVTSEMYPKDAPATSVGENVLDTYSLQSQALWRLNSLYKEATGNNLPQGDYTPEEFIDLIESELKGMEFNLILGTELSPEGDEQTRVQKVKKA